MGRQLRERGVKFVYRNEIGANTQLAEGEVDCLLVNTTGELRFFYEHATVVFVGKSLTAVGGQNPIEPGALGKAMVFGPNMQNFADITRNFVAQNAAVQVGDRGGAGKRDRRTCSPMKTAATELGRNALGGPRKPRRDRPHGGNDFGKSEGPRNLHRAGKYEISS